jgi:hypothetical protein
MRVVATVLDTPCWASSEPGKRCPPASPHYLASYPPAKPPAFGEFLRHLVHHVGRKIQYYEIWNEPNLPRFWAHPDPAAYTRLLRVAYRAIKAENPRAQVLAGATSGSDVAFIDRLYAAGAKPYFDALSVHPYTGSHSPTACSPPRRSLRCGVERIRRVMLRHGDTRPIWLTEFGQSVSAAVVPLAQAEYVTDAIALIRRWTYIRGAIWYELYDDPTGHDGEHFGLFQANLCPRPAASAFRSSASVTKAISPSLDCPRTISAPHVS